MTDEHRIGGIIHGGTLRIQAYRSIFRKVTLANGGIEHQTVLAFAEMLSSIQAQHKSRTGPSYREPLDAHWRTSDTLSWISRVTHLRISSENWIHCGTLTLVGNIVDTRVVPGTVRWMCHKTTSLSLAWIHLGVHQLNPPEDAHCDKVLCKKSYFQHDPQYLTSSQTTH